MFHRCIIMICFRTMIITKQYKCQRVVTLFVSSSLSARKSEVSPCSETYTVSIFTPFHGRVLVSSDTYIPCSIISTITAITSIISKPHKCHRVVTDLFIPHHHHHCLHERFDRLVALIAFVATSSSSSSRNSTSVTEL